MPHRCWHLSRDRRLPKLPPVSLALRHARIQLIRRTPVFSELPLSAIEPQGWLKAYLKKQKDGLTGNLDKTGGFPFNTFGWGGPGLSDVPAEWWSYEQTAYWVDGMVRCGHLLGDKELIEKAHKQIDYVLDHPDGDGYLGPKYLKQESRWPHVVFFRALFAEGSATGDARIAAAIKRHFLSSPYPHSAPREACAIEAMLWAYERDGDPALLEMAQDVYRRYETSDAKFNISPAMFTDGRPCNAHGVSYNELAKLGAMLYAHTGDPDYLKVSTEAYKKIDQYHMLVDGVNSSTELMHEVDPLESHETCNISDYSWTVGYLLMATGQAEYSDKIERACFNAAPGAVKRGFHRVAVFLLSQPGDRRPQHKPQLVLSRRSHHGLRHGAHCGLLPRQRESRDAQFRFAPLDER